MKIEKFTREGSGWVFMSMMQYLNLSFFKPLKRQSYVELPKKVQLKEAVINVKNREHKCFLWAILATLHP